MSDIGYARLFMISTGRRGKTKFSSTNIFKGRKINTQQSESEEEEQKTVVESRSSAPVVLDDSEYAIPDEWGLKEVYNVDESVVNHGDTLYPES